MPGKGASWGSHPSGGFAARKQATDWRSFPPHAAAAPGVACEGRGRHCCRTVASLQMRSSNIRPPRPGAALRRVAGSSSRKSAKQRAFRLHRFRCEIRRSKGGAHRSNQNPHWRSHKCGHRLFAAAGDGRRRRLPQPKYRSMHATICRSGVDADGSCGRQFPRGICP
jgi:hypothetical protein